MAGRPFQFPFVQNNHDNNNKEKEFCSDGSGYISNGTHVRLPIEAHQAHQQHQQQQHQQPSPIVSSTVSGGDVTVVGVPSTVSVALNDINNSDQPNYYHSNVLVAKDVNFTGDVFNSNVGGTGDGGLTIGGIGIGIGNGISSFFRIKKNFDAPGSGRGSLLGGMQRNNDNHGTGNPIHNDTGPPQPNEQTHLPRIQSSNSVDRIDPKQVDDILSKELMQMSFQERSKIQEEAHGVRNAMEEAVPVETPELLQSSLMELHRYLAQLPPSEKLAWSEAQGLPVTYIRDSGFELRFLRCELFNAKKAAKRLVQFVDMVNDYFGPIALQRPPRLDDFNAEEMEIMKAGALMQVLPFRDRSGRKILTCVGDFGLQNKYISRCRIYVYMFLVATEDLDTQRNGVVIVIWPGPADMKLASPNRKEHVEGSRIFDSVPMRLCCMHFCFRDTPLYRLIKAGLVMMLGEQKARFRLLVGEDLELRYDIMGYGIPMDLIPITETGRIKTKNLKDWLKVRSVIEQGNVHPTPIDCPATHDVVFGYGKAFTMHPGNVMYRGLLEEYCEEHRVSTTLEAKKKITWKIVEEVENMGGRFLLWDKRGWWTPFVDRKEIRSKVAVTLKDHTRRVMARQNVTNTSSSTLKFERQDGKKRKREAIEADDQQKPGLFACGGGCGNA